MNHSKRIYEKDLRRRHRRANKKHKANERLRCFNYQRTIDSFERTMQRKGNGRAKKIKGETMPTMLCSNPRSAKSWKHLNGKPMRGESMKVAIIYDLT